MMRDHAEADRLVRNDLLGLGDDRLSARFILRSGLEQNDVIREFDGERVVGTVDAEDTFSQLL